MPQSQTGPDEPSTKRKSKAGLVMVAAVVTMIVAIFVGYNISHVDEMNKEKTGAQQRKGLIGD
ncbi:hypothetical protein EDF58_11638 [Novosphingobium sp. PhB57]|uniref:hypothetical protein n=1 Tax=Novosphingobium sp. PhB57 TaxID=2485107 RepID=UPI0010455957|nr:hypothetical protein [Novosphingobium sp. PhB57]TCU52303.1 hypothetical protein EDF58_11638 [Novosphingobium sp. PhB57]